MTIQRLSGEDVAGSQYEALLRVFAAALGFAPRSQRVLAQGASMRRHTERAGFTAFGAIQQPGLVGFTYGYTSQPGLWWREQIAPRLAPEWLEDAFELVELHVHPAWQGQHLGSGLHDTLLTAVPNRTALLSVMHSSERARQLYSSRGWQVLIEDMRFSTEPSTPFSVLGLRL